ncbi:MAG: hypothetical protein K0R39_3876 [Symbiobacteriaceae bacterium]|nr:hypothetical protein [Symbiobacteriaceae bacterium]
MRPCRRPVCWPSVRAIDARSAPGNTCLDGTSSQSMRDPRHEQPSTPTMQGFSGGFHANLAPTIRAREIAVLSCKSGRGGSRPGGWAPRGRRGRAGARVRRPESAPGGRRPKGAQLVVCARPWGLRPDLHAGPSKTRARMGGEPEFAPQTGVLAGSDHPRTGDLGAIMQKWAQRQASWRAGPAPGSGPRRAPYSIITVGGSRMNRTVRPIASATARTGTSVDIPGSTA